jgi:hypothetical protein
MDSPSFEWGSAGLVFQQCAGAPALMTMRTLSLLNSRQQKRATRMDSPFFEWGSAGLAFQQCAEAPALMTMRTLSLLNSRQ